jgi:hypothetical protein
MMMARALHPSALPEEAAVSMRLAQAQMVEHRLEEAAVMRRLHDDAAGQVEPHGGMCSVTLVRARARAGEGSARHWWWELAARSSSDGGSGGSSDGSGSDSGCSGGSSGASSDSGHQLVRELPAMARLLRARLTLTCGSSCSRRMHAEAAVGGFFTATMLYMLTGHGWQCSSYAHTRAWLG